MDYKAKLRYIKISPKKLAIITDIVRGKKLSDAEIILKTTPKKGAFYISKLLKSAESSAREKGAKDLGALSIKELYVGPGPMLKRGQPVARGSWHPILKRTSHLSVTLSEEAKK